MKASLSTIRKYKKQHCKGVKGSYAKMRSECKKYVDQAYKKAKTGTKTATKDKARKAALKIVKGSCKL